MLRISTALIMLASSYAGINRATPAVPPQSAADAILGRWDLTLAGPNGPQPSWLEVRPSGNGYLVGQFVGVVGSAGPISRVDFTNGVMRFAIPPQWEQGK